MNPRVKKFWLWGGAIAVLITLGFVVRIPQHLTLDEAREIADKRFLAYAEGYHLRPTDFGPPRIQDRDDEWLFEWYVLKGEGKLTVIVRRNGEIFDGGDERLELTLQKK